VDTKTGDYYRQERREVEALIPQNTMRVLDVGCGEGVFGKRLLERGVKEVVGIEVNPGACIKPERICQTLYAAI
jgi:2-polyprenyl-3-methyl-5-hydroxy-6-metoxy-1,4-benzoquinol methylase